MARTDANRVADLHVRAFPGFFLTSLGRRFLATYYVSIVDFGEIGHVAVSGHRLVGFACGTRNSTRFHRELLRRRGPVFAWQSIPALLKRPSSLPRLLRTFTKHCTGDEKSLVKGAMLTSLAVDPDFRRAGLGRRLLDAFKISAVHAGSQRVFLETDAETNDEVLAFYRREGFEHRRVYRTAEQRRMYELTLELSDCGYTGGQGEANR